MKFMSGTFAHGNGPYPRVLDLGVAINDELERRGEERLPIIMPLVYGDRQKRIMQEEWEALGKDPKGLQYEVLLDEFYGDILNELFFKGGNYQENLEFLIENQPKLEERLIDYLSGTLKVKTLDDKELEIRGEDVEFEISHNPRVATKYPVSFCTTIGYFSEILSYAAYESEIGNLNFDPKLLDEVVNKIANKIEEDKAVNFMPEPFVFSYLDDRERWRNEIFTPPFIHPPFGNNEHVVPGMYVMVTGIDGLQGLFGAVNEFGMKLYCNPFFERKGTELEEAIPRTPDFVANPNVLVQFARTGWSTVWLSHMTGTPLIAPAYTKGDDPEIWFNEKSVKALGLAVIFDGKRNPRKVLEEAFALQPRIKEVNEKLLENYGTLDGMNYTARAIVDFYLGEDTKKYYEKEPCLHSLLTD